jgi:hypothetical protein
MSPNASATTISGTTADAIVSELDKSVALDEIKHVWQALLQARSQAARFAQLRDSLQKIVQNHMGSADFGLIDGIPVASYKRSVRIFVSQQLVKERHPEIAADCEDITEVRTFRVLVA